MSDHGYLSYSHGCRCEVCRAGKAAYMREKRAEARAYAKTLIAADGSRYVARIAKHGISGYKDHKCRCATCTAASSAEWQRRKRGAA